MAVPLQNRLLSYLEPLILLSISLIFFPVTLLSNPLLPFQSIQQFRFKWFSDFWAVMGPKMANNPQQIPHIKGLISRAKGVVLDVGPGNGDQMFHFSSVRIDKIYGAEPNLNLHAKLRENAEKHGLKGHYIPIEAGAEPGTLLPGLKKAGLLPPNAKHLPSEGVFDTIICIKSMCSVDTEHLPAAVAIFQALLKPGGEFLFFEHLANNTDWITIAFGTILGPIWTLCMGNCHLRGNLDKVVEGMGGWKKMELSNMPEFQGVEVIRYMKGVVVKA